jgi:hypothetical protein
MVGSSAAYWSRAGGRVTRLPGEVGEIRPGAEGVGVRGAGLQGLRLAAEDRLPQPPARPPV